MVHSRWLRIGLPAESFNYSYPQPLCAGACRCQAHQKASLLEQQQAWIQAAEVYRLVLRDHPDTAEFHFRRGHCLLRINQPGAAAGSFQRRSKLMHFRFARRPTIGMLSRKSLGNMATSRLTRQRFSDA